MKVSICCRLQFESRCRSPWVLDPLSLRDRHVSDLTDRRLHSVRGPLEPFKEKLLSRDDVSPNILQYFSD